MQPVRNPSVGGIPNPLRRQNHLKAQDKARLPCTENGVFSARKRRQILKVRLDKLLVERGLAASRERAQALVLAGRVLVQEQKVEKSGTPVDQGAEIRLLGEDMRYVSRGGLKLERALEHWCIRPDGRNCVDIGTSTGGFSDCLLQHGAARVLCVDTGYGQIAQKLRDDPRISLMERTNARLLEPAAFAHFAAGQGIGLLVMDVSFISATLVLPAVVAAIRSCGTAFDAIVLVKPQFESGRENIGKGGIVRDPAAQEMAVERVAATIRDLGADEIDVIDSPILGMEGNREFLLHALFR